jgi:Protein of unknown function (DUF4058)
MPMHDWTRVKAGTYHDFHCRWLAEITNRLNAGVLPGDHYAQVEPIAGEMVADILTLHAGPSHEAVEHADEGGVAVESAPPQVKITDTIEEDFYSTHAKHIAIRHSSDDRVVALIELLSPGNKSGEYAFRSFVDKAIDALRLGCHLLLIDPFPPGPRDPNGIHGAVWGELGGNYEILEEKPLTLVAYDAGLLKKAYVEPFAVGDCLTAMPLLLSSRRYVPVPLEESYMATYRGVPRRWREVLEAT